MADDRVTRTIVCLSCPRGCRMRVVYRGDGASLDVAGNACPKGEEYARSEVTNPVRLVTTTVRTVFPEQPRAAVRSSREIPFRDIFPFMAESADIVLQEWTPIGGIVAQGLLDGRVDLILTTELDEEPGVMNG